MATATWPTAGNFPQRMQLGFKEAPVDQTLRTQMDSGPAKTRRRYTGIIRVSEGIITLTDAQLATFESFYYNTLEGGTLRFNWVRPADNSTVIEARFVGAPQLLAKACGVSTLAITVEELPS